jgi:hypothetical protein
MRKCSRKVRNVSKRESTERPIATVRLNTSDPDQPIIKNTSKPFFDRDFGWVTCAEGCCFVEAKERMGKGGKLPGQQGNINIMYIYHRSGEMPCETCRRQLQLASQMMGPFRVWGGTEEELQYLDAVAGVLYGPFHVANDGEKGS